VDGHAYDIKVVKSLEPSLDANAIEAVRKWKFEPATKDEKTVAVFMIVEVDYRLH
jgi:TonB family protein